MEVEEPNTNDEEKSSEAVEAVGNPTENNGPNSDEICLANDNPLAANTLSTPFDKKPRKKKAPGPFKKKDVKKWKTSYPYIRRIMRKVDYVCSYFCFLVGTEFLRIKKLVPNSQIEKRWYRLSQIEKLVPTFQIEKVGTNFLTFKKLVPTFQIQKVGTDFSNSKSW